MSLEVQIKKRFPGFQLDARFECGGETLALLGASGSGKTLTLNCIAGVARPDEGRIVLDGRVLFDSQKRVNLSPQERGVGLLFQSYALFPNMTAEQNILCGFSRIRDRRERARRLDGLVEKLRLGGLEKRYPSQLSGGQQQRVALRCAVPLPEGIRAVAVRAARVGVGGGEENILPCEALRVLEDGDRYVAVCRPEGTRATIRAAWERGRDPFCRAGERVTLSIPPEAVQPLI